MKNHNKTLAGLCAVLLLIGAGSLLPVQAQPGSRFLDLDPPTGLPVVPVMEGWYDNEDGSRTISFGYYNRNREEAPDIPLGENNYIEPAEFDGMQPTHFETGRHTGTFTVTLPPDAADQSIRWYLKTGSNEVLSVPGRAVAEAYELDRRPRPQGSLAPEAWFEPDGPRSAGPDGMLMEIAGSVRVGEPVTLTVHTRDPSMRDRSDARFADPIPVRVTWFRHQGPAPVSFSRHESTPAETTAGSEDEDDEPAPEKPPGPETVMLDEGEGTARVNATFPEAGEYLLRVRVDNWSASDSSQDDQCCWTNVYQRVRVSR